MAAEFPGGIKSWTPIINGNTSDVDQINTVYEEVTAIETYISTEVPILVSSDTLLNNKISTETSLRTSGDTLVQSNLNTEISNRVSGDTLVQSNLNTEISNRISQDSTLQTSINTANSLRLSADTILTNNLNTEVSNRISGDTLVQSNLNAETSQRISADNIISSNLSTEISNRQVQNKVYHGIFERSTVSPLPTHITTTTFTLATGTTPMTYYHQGNRLTVNTDVSTVLNDGLGGTTAGLYFVYWNNGYSTISATKSFPGLLSTSDVLIATVCWNGSNHGLINDERHSYNRNTNWHQYTHQTVGTRWGNGTALTHNSGTGAAATFALTTGTIWDEDIQFTIPASSQWPTPNAARLCYQNSTTTYTFDTVTSTVPFKMGANNRPVYVDNNYNIVEMTSATNKYINVFVYLTTDVHTPMHIFTETVNATVASNNGYSNVTAARAVGFPNLSQISLANEFKAIYRLIVRADGQLQAIDIALDDYRLVSSVPTSAGVAANNAINISATPHSTYLVGTNVQVQLDQAESSLSTEVSNRISGDASLNNSISTETSLRVSGDIILTNNLSTETSLRTSADSILQTNINSEASLRVSGDAASAKFLNGTGTFPSSATSCVVSSDFITVNTGVTISPTSEKVGYWTVESQSGQFIITSDSVETTNVSFDYWAVK